MQKDKIAGFVFLVHIIIIKLCSYASYYACITILNGAAVGCIHGTASSNAKLVPMYAGLPLESLGDRLGS